PEFMVPAIFVVLKALPLSAVGKVDRGALPAPQPAFRAAGAESPATEMQKAIAAIWKTAAGIENPGPDDNFFDLGGNSLAIAAIEAELKSRFDADLPVTDLFRYPTIRSLADRLAHVNRELPWISNTQARAAKQKNALNKLRQAGSRHTTPST
ncbi:MAG: phosphopantetheine-binding protein, partial [Bryobacteraceae bacterium]